MLPWLLPRRGPGEEEVLEEHGSSVGSDQGETWSSGEEAPGEPGTPPQDSPQPQSLNPSWTLKKQLPPSSPPGLAAEQSPGTPASPFPQMTWDVSSSTMVPLAPWDPNYEAEAGPRLWGPSSGSGVSFSGRTLCHPSFWPLYEAASSRDPRPLVPAGEHHNGGPLPGDAGFPALCCEDVFLSDPLLPYGQRIPLYLAQAQQVMSSLQLLVPPPVMSPRVVPTSSPYCSAAWLTGPELIALTGLLQMSQGEARPSSSTSSVTLDHPYLVSADPNPTGGPSCSHFPDPSLPPPPDTHLP